MAAIMSKRLRRNINPNSLKNLSEGGSKPDFDSPKVLASVRISEEVKVLLDKTLGGQPKHINRSTVIEAMLRALFDRPSDLSWNDLLAIADDCKIIQEHQAGDERIRVWHDTIDNTYVARSSSGLERGESIDRKVAEAIAQKWADELR